MKADPNPLARAAEDYAKRGWYVFPVKPRDKVPMTAQGFKNASNNLDVVREWWAKTPQANIGLDCGRSGLVVVDLDKRGEHDGLDEWRRLTAAHQLQADTATSLTGGGGRHLLFQRPPESAIRNSAGRLAPGIDIRADGGYIVLPPSIHPSGTPYAWADSPREIVPLPPLVVDLLAAEPDPWRIYSLRDAHQPRPPLTWLVDRILPAGSLSIWYGAPGTLKSMILADLCVCVAGGLPWLTHPKTGGGYRVAESGVLWLDFDNGARRTHERFQALSRAHGVPVSAPLYYVSMPDPYLDAGDTAAMGALAQRIMTREIGLVVIDNLGVVSGSADENTADMQRPMGGLRWLAEATGAAVAVLHHQRKSNGFSVRSGETLRGHGSIEAKLDLALQVSRDGNTIALAATKSRGAEVKPFSATFAYENDPHHELVTARFWPAGEAAETPNSEAQVRLERAILDYIRRFPNVTAAQVFKHIGGNKQHFYDTLRQLDALGHISKAPGTGGHSTLTVPAK